MWTEANLATLRKLWTEGASYSAIAQVIGGGLTRSAVAGKVRRIGLPYRKDPKDGTAAYISRVQRARKAARKRAVVFIPNKVLKPTKIELLRTEIALIAALPPLEPGLTIETIRPNQCRYMNGDPQTDGTLCGRLTASGSWCSQHRKLVYQPSKPKARLTRSVEGDEKRRQLRELARREQFQMGVAV